MIKINNICIRDMKTSGDKFVKKISPVIAACILGVTFFFCDGLWNFIISRFTEY